VTDVWMPQMTGLELHAALSREGCAPPMILVSGEATVPVTIGALRACAVDFLEKPFRREELLESIEVALRLDRERREEAARRGEARRRLVALTPRQREVVDLIVAGADNLAIARRLNMSVATVESHRARVMQALGVQTLAELMRLAVDAAA
jgi:FixJ family two-component response regulator